MIGSGLARVSDTKIERSDDPDGGATAVVDLKLMNGVWKWRITFSGMEAGEESAQVGVCLNPSAPESDPENADGEVETEGEWVLQDDGRLLAPVDDDGLYIGQPIKAASRIECTLSFPASGPGVLTFAVDGADSGKIADIPRGVQPIVWLDECSGAAAAEIEFISHSES